MNFSEFINNLKSIVSIYDKTIDLDIKMETLQHPKNFFLIQNINKHINIDKCIEYEVTPLGLEFCFHNKNEYKFLIKTDDMHLEEPPLYYNNLPFLKSSSEFLLTELAEWYSALSSNTYSFKHLMISTKIRNLSEKIIYVDDYGKNLRINDSSGIFIIVKQPGSYIIASKDKTSLDNVLNDLGLIIETKKESGTYNSKNIFDGKINGNELNGKIKFISKVVDISIISEEKQISEKSFDSIINKWGKLLSRISKSNYEDIKTEISKEMTRGSFSQSDFDSKNFKIESQKLYKDLEIEKAILTNNSISLSFKAKKEYPDGSIIAILKKNGSLDECYFE